MSDEPQTFVERIVQDAKDDGADARLLERFREVAAVLAPLVPESDDVKYAAFVDEKEASVVVQSLKTDRRLNVDLSADPLEILRIDENMKHHTNVCQLDNHAFLVAVIRWCVEGSKGKDALDEDGERQP